MRNRFAAVARLSNTDVKCYADCPNATVEDITWCVHIFHPVHDITLCKNISGVVNASQIAVEAGLLEHFEVPEVCLVLGGGKVLVCNGNLLTGYLLCSGEIGAII